MRHFNTTGPVKPADHYCIHRSNASTSTRRRRSGG